MARHDDKVIRIQGDKLCESLGFAAGTKIDLDLIRKIATAKFGDIVQVEGRDVKLSMHMVGVAKILLEKIEGK